MVKITNPLGDVKVGRQGEAVYQRKYGEQIRRQASPKRAIPSEAQIAHRHLYRAALTWRSNLSLANRRYLDGYCIANGVVDGYHIPLPWSRFALKLYLEKVRFVPDLHIEGVAEQSGVWEYYHDPTDNFGRNVYAQHYLAQTFTPLYGYPIVKAGIKAHHFGIVEFTATIGVKQTDGSGLPTGDFLSYATFGSHLFKEGTPPEWQTIVLPPYAPTKDVKYALVLQMPDAGVTDRLVWYCHPSGTYPRGILCVSSDYGVTWTPAATWDFQFDIYQYQAATYKKLGILHVKHPALLKIVHERGVVNINGYDTLSSLDDEYLTGQVGLDVEEGDSIKATTLPGIDYDYVVF